MEGSVYQLLPVVHQHTSSIPVEKFQTINGESPNDKFINETKLFINRNESTRTPSTTSVTFLCFHLDAFSKTVQFLILSAGIFAFYLLYGFFQELIFRLDGFKSYGWYLTLIQFALYSLFGKIEIWLRQEEGRRIPIKLYLLLAMLTLVTMGFSNTSVGYINYPTQVMFKCCKLIPVLIGSIVIQGKKYGSFDFIAAGCMSAGLIFFTLADSKISPNFNVVGIMMICSALVADAIIGNVQEKTMKTYQASNAEMVLYSYFIGFWYLFFGAMFFGGLVPAYNFCAKFPMETYGYAIVFSATGYLGIQLVLGLIKVSGVFVAVTVTTFRKALSIIISFLLFSKPFTFQYVWAGLLVILGIYLNVYSKNKESFHSFKLFSRLHNTFAAKLPRIRVFSKKSLSSIV